MNQLFSEVFPDEKEARQAAKRLQSEKKLEVQITPIYEMWVVSWIDVSRETHDE